MHSHGNKSTTTKVISTHDTCLNLFCKTKNILTLSIDMSSTECLAWSGFENRNNLKNLIYIEKSSVSNVQGKTNLTGF